MQRVTDQVDMAYLRHPSPRPLSPFVVVSLLLDHMRARMQALLDPSFVIGLVALVALLALSVPHVVWMIPAALILMRVVAGAHYLWRHVSDDLALLRKGLLLRAHVLKLRPHRTLNGDINGALLDCVIVVAPRRTYVGSVWIAEGSEALRLSRQGRVEVICLPRTPGTWRIVEHVQSEVRYDRVGPVAVVPQDV